MSDIDTTQTEKKYQQKEIECGDHVQNCNYKVI